MGIPTDDGFLTERQLYEMRDLVNMILTSAMHRKLHRLQGKTDHRLEGKISLQEMMFRTYGGEFRNPSTPFEYVMRILYALAENGTLSRVRKCLACNRFYIGHKIPEKRKGKKNNQSPQRFCHRRECKNAKSRLWRLEQKMDIAKDYAREREAIGQTGKRMTADPRNARPAMRYTRQRLWRTIAYAGERK